MTRTYMAENRSFDMRRDNDNFKTPSVTIYDIDYAIYAHLKNNINPQITKNGNTFSVPVIIANGEKWVQLQRNGFLRDKNTNQVLSPLISIKRLSMADDDRFKILNFSKTDPIISLRHYPAVQSNNANDLPRSNNNMSTEFYVTPIPQRVRVTYELNIWGNTTNDINAIVESIMPHSDNLWGESFQFVTAVEDYSFDVTSNVGEDRISRCTISLMVDGYLLPEYDQKQSTLEKAYSLKRVVFETETEQEGFYIDHLPKIISPSIERLNKILKK